MVVLKEESVSNTQLINKQKYQMTQSDNKPTCTGNNTL